MKYQKYNTSYIIKCILGIILLFSGITKTISIQGFAMEIIQYCELYISPNLSSWSVELAVVMCGFEIVLGSCLLFNMLHPYSEIAVLCLMAFFTYLTGINYLMPTIFGSVESCGCFGEVIHFTPLGAFIKSVVLFALSIGVFILHTRPHAVDDGEND